jgi:uncharacterized damage-inducible protein DinB
MIIETLKILFKRDLNRLKKEVELYNNEDNLWRVEKDISNSAGNLCLHLIGNLNTYIGKEIGEINYTRDRELEFTLKNISRVELQKKIDETILVVSNSLDKLTQEELIKEYPIMVFDAATTTEYLLVHLTTHLTYHLGQINYHRRLLDK